jgi:hypothetical protein
MSEFYRIVLVPVGEDPSVPSFRLDGENCMNYQLHRGHITPRPTLPLILASPINDLVPSYRLPTADEKKHADVVCTVTVPVPPAFISITQDMSLTFIVYYFHPPGWAMGPMSHVERWIIPPHVSRAIFVSGWPGGAFEGWAGDLRDPTLSPDDIVDNHLARLYNHSSS